MILKSSVGLVIKVITCSGDYWYKDRIGGHFPVCILDTYGNYKTDYGLILKKDAIIVS